MRLSPNSSRVVGGRDTLKNKGAYQRQGCAAIHAHVQLRGSVCHDYDDNGNANTMRPTTMADRSQQKYPLWGQGTRVPYKSAFFVRALCGLVNDCLCFCMMVSCCFSEFLPTMSLIQQSNPSHRSSCQGPAQEGGSLTEMGVQPRGRGPP